MVKDTAKIYRLVRSLSAESPEIALRAVLDGVEDAMKKLREQLSDKDIAFLATLSLADPKRLSTDVKLILNQVIAKRINPQNACIAEQRILNAVKDAGDDAELGE